MRIPDGLVEAAFRYLVARSWSPGSCRTPRAPGEQATSLPASAFTPAHPIGIPLPLSARTARRCTPRSRTTACGRRTCCRRGSRTTRTGGSSSRRTALEKMEAVSTTPARVHGRGVWGEGGRLLARRQHANRCVETPFGCAHAPVAKNSPFVFLSRLSTSGIASAMAEQDRDSPGRLLSSENSRLCLGRSYGMRVRGARFVAATVTVPDLPYTCDLRTQDTRDTIRAIPAVSFELYSCDTAVRDDS